MNKNDAKNPINSTLDSDFLSIITLSLFSKFFNLFTTISSLLLSPKSNVIYFDFKSSVSLLLKASPVLALILFSFSLSLTTT